jgi:hypothetical protein
MITEANDHNSHISEIHLLDILLLSTMVVWVRLVLPSPVQMPVHLYTQQCITSS